MNAALPKLVIAINTIAFAVGFSVWVVFGPSVRDIAKALQLTPAEALWIKTAPILIGSLLRFPVGLLSDRLGSRVVFPSLLLIGAAALGWVSSAGDYGSILLGAAVSGLVGTTFVVGVQSVSSWTPASRQGFALGLFGCGNAGTALTTLAYPYLAASYGWRGAYRGYALMAAVMAVVYWVTLPSQAKRNQLQWSALMKPLASGAAWCIGIYYMATFGVFVAGALMFSDIYMDGYKMTAVSAGWLATTFTLTASLMRAAGGGLSDHYGARRVVAYSLAGVVLFLSLAALPLPLPVVVTLAFIAAAAMGIGMAAALRFVPEQFPQAVGAVSGMIGAVGGLGGFFLPMLGAWVKQATGNANLQLAPLAVFAGIAWVVLIVGARGRAAASLAPLARKEA